MKIFVWYIWFSPPRRIKFWFTIVQVSLLIGRMLEWKWINQSITVITENTSVHPFWTLLIHTRKVYNLKTNMKMTKIFIVFLLTFSTNSFAISVFWGLPFIRCSVILAAKWAAWSRTEAMLSVRRSITETIIIPVFERKK